MINYFRSFINLTHERVFILLGLFCSFLINLEASITKAASNSLFIHVYGYEFLPYAWLGLVPLNYAIVNLYNKFIPKIGLFKMLVCTTSVTIIIFLLAAFFIHTIPSFPFFLYIWKDLYIMLMFQQLWSMLHATIPSEKARYLYGFFWGVGGLGSVVGSVFPGFLATSIGTEKLLLVALPFYLILILTYLCALKVRDKYKSSDPIKFDEKKPSNFLEGVRLIKKSKALFFIFLLIVFMQLTATLIDFEFNQNLSETIHNKDLRTQYLGRFFGIVNSINVILQFLGSYFVIKFLGLKKTHLFIPLYLGVLNLGNLVLPSFSLLALSYGSIKALDYSIFGIAREMLYIPLTTEEKFQGRAVIDVFVYRTAKALASCCIIMFGLLSYNKITLIISKLTFLLFCMWAFAVIFFLKERKEEVKPSLI